MGLRVALIGAGQVANVHLEALRETDGRRGGRDLRPGRRARAEEKARPRNGIPRVYATWEQLLRDDAVQCVGVLLPHDLHERFAVEALAAGKHVVCEKPLGQSIGECDRMLAARRAGGRKLFPVHNRVYGHAVEKLHEIVAPARSAQVDPRPDDRLRGRRARSACAPGWRPSAAAAAS